jgi:hypothetical protein
MWWELALAFVAGAVATLVALLIYGVVSASTDRSLKAKGKAYGRWTDF